MMQTMQAQGNQLTASCKLHIISKNFNTLIRRAPYNVVQNEGNAEQEEATKSARQHHQTATIAGGHQQWTQQ